MMKIYAIRDRLIDYFMQPFVGPDDKSVLASVARLVNQGEVTSDIAQAPHQFEVWTLGIIQEDGTITPERGYLGDCSSLIRRDIRPTGTAEGHRPADAARTSGEDTTGANGGTPPHGGPISKPAQTAPEEFKALHPAA